MASSSAAAADAELRDGPKQDLHSLRERDANLDTLSDEIQRSAAARAANDFRDTADMASLKSLLGDRSVLITGNAGYLGFALYLTLEKLGIPVMGIDVVPKHTCSQMKADVSDLDAVKTAAHGCGAVLHCAALHAPHALNWHEREFTATNVIGTENVLALGLPTVHTSTTSLTITARVKAAEKAGDLVWLDDRAQRPDLLAEDKESEYYPPLDAPRNKYGRTKLQAEQRCRAAAQDGADVVVLRAPRFFPEDVLEESTLTLPNVKANELLGRRCALVDLIDAELRALARIKAVRGKVFTLAAPWPLERPPAGTSAKEAASTILALHQDAERFYAQHGWRLPEDITRVYDCRAAINDLGWRPRVTFEAVLRMMREHEAEEDSSASASSAAPRKQPKTASTGVTIGELLRGAY